MIKFTSDCPFFISFNVLSDSDALCFWKNICSYFCISSLWVVWSSLSKSLILFYRVNILVSFSCSTICDLFLSVSYSSFKFLNYYLLFVANAVYWFDRSFSSYSFSAIFFSFSCILVVKLLIFVLHSLISA